MTKVDLYKTRICYKKCCLYLWKSDDTVDSFIVENNVIVCFPLQSELEKYLSIREWEIYDEDTLIEIISKKELLELLEQNIPLFCEKMLELWNLAIDIKNSFSQKESLLDGHKALYNKVFYGNNLNSMTSDNCKYIPSFIFLEKRQIYAVIKEIYRWFDEKLEKY